MAEVEHVVSPAIIDVLVKQDQSIVLMLTTRNEKGHKIVETVTFSFTDALLLQRALDVAINQAAGARKAMGQISRLAEEERQARRNRLSGA